MANDIGLKSYQDIEMPKEAPNPILTWTDEEWRRARDEALVEIFKDVLEVQEETGTQLWFGWAAHVNEVEVYAPKGADTWAESNHEHEYIVRVIYFERDEDPFDTAARIRENILDWRDRKLAVKRIERLRTEIRKMKEAIEELEEKYGKEN